MAPDTQPADARDRLVAAAFDTLRSAGLAGTSARAIARAAGVNSALVFYYFGSVNALLLAALDASSSARLARYEAAVADIDTLEELVEVALRAYREDVDGGHITVFSELVGASMSQPELRQEIVARAEPWSAFVERTLARFVAGTPLDGMLPIPQLARALIAFYLGVNLLTHLDDDNEQIEELFQAAVTLAPAASALFGSARPPASE